MQLATVLIVVLVAGWAGQQSNAQSPAPAPAPVPAPGTTPTESIGDRGSTVPVAYTQPPTGSGTTAGGGTPGAETTAQSGVTGKANDTTATGNAGGEVGAPTSTRRLLYSLA